MIWCLASQGFPDIQSLGFNLVNTRWDPKGTGPLALDTHPSVQSGQHPLAPKGDRYTVLEVNHVSGSVILCLASQGIPDIQSLGFNLVNTRWDPKGTGPLALDT